MTEQEILLVGGLFDIAMLRVDREQVTLTSDELSSLVDEVANELDVPNSAIWHMMMIRVLATKHGVSEEQAGHAFARISMACMDSSMEIIFAHCMEHSDWLQ